MNDFRGYQPSMFTDLLHILSLEKVQLYFGDSLEATEAIMERELGDKYYKGNLTSLVLCNRVMTYVRKRDHTQSEV